MDTKINYTLVGIFVFSLGLALAGFLLWMGKYGFEEKQWDEYIIKMEDGVSGLNVESPVKFRGVEVGTVNEIRIAPDNPEIIEVMILIEQTTPIKTDSIAVLTAQGITGLSYIEIKGGSKTSPSLPVGGVIKAGKSLFDKLESSATNITEKMVQTLGRIDLLLSEKNLESVEQALFNLRNTTETLSQQLDLLLSPKNIQAIETSLANTALISQAFADERETMQALLHTTTDLEKQAVRTLKDYSTVSKSLNQVLDNINQRIERGEFDVRQMTEHHLETLDALLKELETLSIKTNEVLEQLKDSPSDILFKQQQYKRGPGEL